MNTTEFKVIGFDADDTLWENETYFRNTEEQFCELMAPYCSAGETSEILFKNEIGNIELYGYGTKGFILSMIETALHISNGEVPQELIGKILSLGKEQIAKPIVLLNGVKETLSELKRMDVKLIVATKGDLLDQERKLAKSGLEKYFHHIEIMSEKKIGNYRKLISRLDISPQEFLMVGNSLKSDIQPVLELGGSAVHVPCHTTWQHEILEELPQSNRFMELTGLYELSDKLKMWTIG